MALHDCRRIINALILFWTMCSIALQQSVAQSGNTMNDQSLDASYFFYQQSEYPRDCQEVLDQCSSRNSSGVYYIKPDGYQDPFQVYCDLAEDLKGWTVINRRVTNGTVQCNRDWDSYKRGFGFPSHEYWIGNDRLAYLTNQKEYALHMEMTFNDGSRYVVTFNSFRISDEFSGYSLTGLTPHSSTGNYTVSWCPSNMVYANCTCGQKLCGEPLTCVDTCAMGSVEGCVCHDGYLMDGDECIPRRECGCYVSGERTVVPEGETYINSDCSMEATCSNGQLTINQAYECDSNAVCDEREDGRKCYCNEGYEGNGQRCTSTTPSVDCMDVYNRGSNDSGVYSIKPTNWDGGPFDVYCNMSDGGGWTVFQRRADGSVDFYLGWSDYQTGFGDLNNECWLGNEKVYYITNQKAYRMRIDFVNSLGSPYYAEYSSFSINDAADNYRLLLGSFSGTAGTDALNYHRNKPFSTKDRDNDGASYNCASSYHGAWWYYNCHKSNLNGGYERSTYEGIRWHDLPGSEFNIKFTEMKIRPV